MNEAEAKGWPTEFSESRVMMGNLLLASLKKELVEMCADSVFEEIMHEFEMASAASPILIANDFTMSQFNMMEKKLEALRKVKELRETVRDL